MRTITQFCALLCTSLSLSFLTACGTTTVIDSHSRLSHAGDINKAKVYFLRPDVGYFGLEGNAVSISYDGQKLLTLAKGEYALVYLQPSSGNMTVESTAIRTEFGKTVVKTVKASEQFLFEAGKTYHIAVCKRLGLPENSLGFPVLIDGSYANQGSGALKPVGVAMREPLSLSESIPQTEASSILKDVCVTAQDRKRYDRPIQSDCVKVNQMLLQQQPGDSAINQSDTALSATSFCANVVQQCGINPQGDKCRSLIRSYDAKRYGSGTSLLMQIAATKSPQYGSGDTALMQYLLGIGFNPNARVAGVSSDSMMELIAPGYAARSVGGKWRDVTPLMIATGIGDRRMVEVLLRSGADPNVQNDQGRTALMYAANLTGRLGSDRGSIATDLLAAGCETRHCVHRRFGCDGIDVCRPQWLLRCRENLIGAWSEHNGH